MKQTHVGIGMLCMLLSMNLKAQTWKEHTDSAKFYQAKGATAKALDFYEKSDHFLGRDSSGTATYAENCKMIAALYASQGNYEKAEGYFVIVYETWQKLSTVHPEYAKSCNNLGTVYFTLVKLFKAEVFYKKGKEAWEKITGKKSVEYARSCTNLGNVYNRQFNYPQAEAYYAESRDILSQVVGNTHPEYARACSNLSKVFRKVEEFEKAISLCMEAKSIREANPGRRHIDYAESCANLALLYSDVGRYVESEILALEALALRKELAGEESTDYASSCNDLATLYAIMEDFRKTEFYYKEARRINKKILPPLHPNYALSCNNLGEYYRKMGQYEKAEELYLEAKDIFEKVYSRQHYYYAICSNNLGITYSKMEKLEEAEAQYLEAKDILEKVVGKKNKDYAGVCENLAGVYAGFRKYDLALALINESKDIVQSIFGTEHDAYAQSCSNLGTVYAEMKNVAEAESNFRKARDIVERLFGKKYSHYVEYSVRLGSLLAHSGKAEQALDLYAEAFTIERELLHSVFQFLTETEKQQYIKNVFNRHEDYFSFALNSDIPRIGNVAYNIALSDRSAILNSTIQVRESLLGSRDTAKINLYRQWIEAKEALGTNLVKPTQERRETTSLLEEKVNMLEKELIQLSADFRNLKIRQGATWEAIMEKLTEQEAAIEFVDFQYKEGDRWVDSVYYVAVLLKRNAPGPVIIKLFEESELEPLLKIYKGMSPGQHQINSLYYSNVKGIEHKSAGLYSVIWKHIESQLEGIKTIYFAPAGLLHKVSFAALAVNDITLLSDRYRLIQLNTTASLNNNPGLSLGATDRIQLYGGVQYSVNESGMKLAAVKTSQNHLTTRGLPDDLDRGGVPEFTYLDGTAREINSITRLAEKMNYDVVISNGMKATEESFKNLSGIQSPSVLHFATHGFFFPDPKKSRRFDRTRSTMVFRESDNPLIRSGLALAGANNAWKGKPIAGVEDGILTAYEVSNMYLPNTKLAVLSACETGLGDIQGSEGVYGLQRAFKMAGVENLVMSLWKVPDAETAEFMQQFYKNLFAKQTIQEAFYNTQKVMRNKYRNDPYKWAAWVLIR